MVRESKSRSAMLREFRREARAAAAGRVEVLIPSTIEQVLRHEGRAGAVPGLDGVYRRRCLVDATGTVRAWDEQAGHYSVAHELTDEQIAEAVRLAGIVRAAKVAS